MFVNFKDIFEGEANIGSKLNESSNSELRKLAQSAAKTLGVKITETADSFESVMGAQFEITEKDYRKIVSAFKRAGSDPEELGFYDMTFDNHDLTVLIDFEDVDDSIQFYVPMNESTDSKTFIKELAKSFGIKVNRDSEIFDDYTGDIIVNAYELAKFRYGLVKIGSYGSFKIKKITPDGYYIVNVILEYNNEDYSIEFRSIGSSRLSPPNSTAIVSEIFKGLGIREEIHSGKIRNFLVTDVSPETYSKLLRVKPGDVFGDIIIDKVGERPNGGYSGNPFIIEALTSKGFAELVFRNAESLNESVNEVTGLPKYKLTVPNHLI